MLPSHSMGVLTNVRSSGRLVSAVPFHATARVGACVVRRAYTPLSHTAQHCKSPPQPPFPSANHTLSITLSHPLPLLSRSGPATSLAA